MREIKFRMWVPEENGEPGHMISGDNLAFEEYLPLTQLLSQEGVMQFTGLKDKNGVEIYEGDIVKAWVDFGPAGKEQRIFEVAISPFGVNIQEFGFKESGYLPKVIGNIYENENLLEA